jgi:peptide/nickel transport system substrate-binding protein
MENGSAFNAPLRRLLSMTARFTGKRLIILAVSIGLVAYIIFLSTRSIKDSQIGNKAKGTLTIAFDSKIQTGDPRIIGSDANSQYIENIRFLSLVGFDEQGNLMNILANEIKPISNKSWKISLRKGIKFNNGKEIDAYDVEATYQQIMSPPKGFPPSPRKGAFSNVSIFKANSHDEILIELKTPDSSFLNNLIIGTLPKEAATSANPNEINNKGYESGPFLLKSSHSSEWVLVRNENFNFSNKPKMNEIHFKIITDSGTRYAALVKGDIDIAQNAIDPDKISLIQKSKSEFFNILSAPKLSTTFLAFNFKDSAFNNLKIRQAIAYAIDRKSLLQFRLQGQGVLAKSMFSPSNYYFDDSIAEIPFNPQRAKTLLKEANIQDIISFAIKVSSSNKSTVEVAKAIAANLKEVGFDPSVEMLENSVFLDQVKRGVAKIWISSWVGFKDPDHLRFAFASNMVPPAGGNRGGFSNASVDELLQEGREEIDPVKRKMIYDQAQKLLGGELPYVYLWHSLNVAVVSKNVEGYRLYADGRYWSLINVTKK